MRKISLELVADEEDRLAGRLQLADDAVELLHLLVGERGGRLVHDDDLGVHGKGARDGDQMLARDGEIAEARRRIEVDLELVEDRLGARVHRLPVEQPEAAGERMAEEDVLGDGELVEEHRLLVGRRDAAHEGDLGVADLDGRAVHQDLAGIGRVDAGEDLHQRRLAGAVLADERGDGARRRDGG